MLCVPLPRWATVSCRAYYAASSERRREIEIIFGWLAFTKYGKLT